MTPDQMLMEALENQARQTMLNQALYRIIEQNGGSVSFPLDLLNGNGMGGVVVEVNGKTETVTLSTASDEEVEAYAESFSEDKH